MHMLYQNTLLIRPLRLPPLTLLGQDEGSADTPTHPTPTPPPSTEASLPEEASVLKSKSTGSQDVPHKDVNPMPKEATAEPTTTTTPESTEASHDVSKISELPNMDKPKTLIVSIPPPASNEAENEPTTNEGVTPLTPTPTGGMFSRLRKVWQGAEPKVHELTLNIL